MNRRLWKFASAAAVVLFLVALFAPQFTPSWLGPKDQEIVEKLREPHTVVDWDEHGLWLADGRHVRLTGTEPLPLNSPLLEQAIVHGVELTPEGRVIGLLKIHHWCGNDPVRLHLARVDLADLLTYSRPVSPEPRLQQEFAEYGWSVSHFCQFLGERELAATQR